MKVLISAGHQPGLDSGAVGQGQQESNENVRICDRVVLYLRAWGINTIYMPNNVGNLDAEIKWANANLALGQGYAIQIHRNAGGGTGNEVWTTAYADQIPLATAILKAMTEITKLPSRGVKDIKTSNWPLGWINYVNAESVLIEARFIDRDDVSDAEDMEDAYAIACGIADFLKIPRGKSEEQKQIEAAKAAADAQAAAKAEAERLAKIAAEQARIASMYKTVIQMSSENVRN
jgi:N-acetylmuramoyl-L-alanine amidase